MRAPPRWKLKDGTKRIQCSKIRKSTKVNKNIRLLVLHGSVSLSLKNLSIRLMGRQGRAFLLSSFTSRGSMVMVAETISLALRDSGVLGAV